MPTVRRARSAWSRVKVGRHRLHLRGGASSQSLNPQHADAGQQPHRTAGMPSRRARPATSARDHLPADSRCQCHTAGKAAITLLVARAAASSLLTTPISDWSAERLAATWSSVDDIGAPVSTETCQARASSRRPACPERRACCRQTLTTSPPSGVGSMALAKHLAVGGGDGQRSGWHLTDPKVGRQYGACLRDIGSRPEGGSSSSVLDDQAGGGDCDQQRGAGKYGALSIVRYCRQQ